MSFSSVMVANPTNHQSGGNIKKQIRDTTRLLSRPTLAADLRMAQERKLKALQLALEEQAKGQVERKMVERYRMIRFFERKKALRHSAQAARRMEQAKDEQEYAMALEQLRVARADFFYALCYPRDRKYIALYPKQQSQVVDGRVEEERRKLKEEISRQVMAEAKVDSIELVPLPKEQEQEEEEETTIPLRSALAPNGSYIRRGNSEDDDDDDDDDEEEEEEEDGSDDHDDKDSDDNDNDDDDDDGEEDLSDSGDFDDDDDEEDSDDFGSEDDGESWDEDSDEDDDEDSESEDDDDEDDEEFDDDDEEEDEDDDDVEPSSKKQRKH